ncbi:hypothetical protein JB92DRAFT_2716890 [Gautieria morchelliformis]|nr:hypothetical protein JB92DRAFT_2716890 [Gautieria morchelliformis]
MANNWTALPPGIVTPDTPLAFLPSDVGLQLEASRYLYIATVSAYVWDLLCSLGDDYHLITKFALTIPTVVYFVSRIMTLAFILTSMVFQIAPVDSCQALQVALGWCFAVALPSTSLLFFFRIMAVFNRQRRVIAFFAILWLASLGGAITVPFAIEGGHIGPTKLCINTNVKSFSSVGFVMNTCNDILIFLAISWEVVSRAPSRNKVRSFFAGRDLPFVSKELLQGGQQYFMITVGMNLLTMILLLLSSSSIPPVIKAMFTIPNVALENSMACRVFRNIKLGKTTNANVRTTGNGSSVSADHGLPVYALKSFGGGERRGRVEIRRTVEQFDDAGPSGLDKAKIAGGSSTRLDEESL